MPRDRSLIVQTRATVQFLSDVSSAHRNTTTTVSKSCVSKSSVKMRVEAEEHKADVWLNVLKIYL